MYILFRYMDPLGYRLMEPKGSFMGNLSPKPYRADLKLLCSKPIKKERERERERESPYTLNPKPIPQASKQDEQSSPGGSRGSRHGSSNRRVAQATRPASSRGRVCIFVGARFAVYFVFGCCLLGASVLSEFICKGCKGSPLVFTLYYRMQAST